MQFLSQIERWIFKSRAYKRLFNLESQDAQVVLNDLRKFCGADQPSIRVASNGVIDPYATAVAEGRREVWLRIQAQLQLSEQALAKLKEQSDD